MYYQINKCLIKISKNPENHIKIKYRFRKRKYSGLQGITVAPVSKTYQFSHFPKQFLQ